MVNLDGPADSDADAAWATHGALRWARRVDEAVRHRGAANHLLPRLRLHDCVEALDTAVEAPAVVNRAEPLDDEPRRRSADGQRLRNPGCLAMPRSLLLGASGLSMASTKAR